MTNVIPGPIDQQPYLDQLADDSFKTDFHAKISIVFGDLIETGYDWGRDKWHAYSMDAAIESVIRQRINEMIELQYFYLEIGTLPVRRFSDNMVRTLNNVMKKLGPIYQAIADGIDLQETGSNKNISRELNSDYPQSALAPTTEDYATSSVESVNQSTGKLALLELFERFPAFDEPDAQVLKALRPCFSYVYSFNF